MNFLGQDRPDLQYATKQATRKMASPTETGVPRLQQIGRYLIEAERVVWHVRETDGSQQQLTLSWVAIGLGCLNSVNSTSAGMLSVAGTSL